MTNRIQGTITALATPFVSGEVDKSSFCKLLKLQKQSGIDGVVINGTTAESPTLQWEEVEALFALAREEFDASTRLLVGTGSNDTRETIEKSRQASVWPCDALLVVVPYYNKPTQQGLIQHFEAVADASQKPVVLYDVPGRTITSLSIDTIAHLSRHSNIVGIKDATGDIKRARLIKERCGESFSLLSGDDSTCVELGYVGGHGVISVISNIVPRQLKQLMDRALRQDDHVVKEYQEGYADLLRACYIEPNPIPIKMALHLMDVFSSPELRLPLTTLSEDALPELKTSLLNKGLVDE